MFSQRKCPGVDLEKILPYTGLRLKKTKLILHSGDISCITPTKAKVYSAGDMGEIEAHLRSHIPECLGCFFSYYNFLNSERRGKKSIKEVDSEYLHIFR